MLDPSSGIDVPLDIAIRGDRIAALQPRIPREQARLTIDVTDKLVTPELIDVHAHCTGKLHVPTGMEPDLGGVRAGVTTLVDGGSTGAANVAGLCQYVIRPATTRVVAMLNVAQTGLAVTPEIRDRHDMDLEATVEAARRHAGDVRGIKLRAVGPGLHCMGLDLVRHALNAARAIGGPLMVHIGDWETPSNPPLTSEFLPLLEPGDMVTHAFTPHPGGLLDANGRLLPEAREAAERGVYVDIAHGMNNLSFDVARRVLDQGLRISTISTDLSSQNRKGPVYSLTETMSKCLALGLTLSEVIRATTAVPASFLGMQDEIGRLTVGSSADISVLDVIDGAWDFIDSVGQHLVGRQAIVPILTIKSGVPVTVDWGPRPWGWLPARVA